MELFDDYVLQSELAAKTGVTVSALCAVNTTKKKMGGLTCIKKSDLPEKYKETSGICKDLDNYCSYNYLSKALGMSRDFLSTLEYDKKKQKKPPFESVKVGGIRLFKLNKEFVEKVKEGLTPFRIKNKEDEEYATEIIEMQGLKIGFY